MDRSMRIRINDFLVRNESPVITPIPACSRPTQVFTGGQLQVRQLSRQPLSGGWNPKDSDLASDYGPSFRQTHRDGLILS
jgi:hypothetical protein